MRWLALSTIALAACVDAEPIGQRAEAIVAGNVTAADPAIVALTEADGRVVCSGTLISPHVVLTAAHCGIDAKTFRSFRAVFGASARAGLVVALSDARVHPDFDAKTFANDLALLTLRARSEIPPVALADKGGAASLPTAKLRIVGFGISAAMAGDLGTKREGTARVDAIAATTFHLAPEPSQPCVGDSGGPALLAAASGELLVGVTSNGDDACVKGATETRVDPYVDTFIAPYLARSSEGTVAPGDRCLFPEHCAGGVCVAAEDEPAITYCATSCSDDLGCRAGMRCRAGQCRFPLPTPGALGARCAADADCVEAECSPSLGVCARRCNPVAPVCPADFACKNTTTIRFECVASPPSIVRGGGGGCATTAAPPDAAAPLALLAIASLCRRIKRR